MFLLVLGIAAAIGTIAWITFGLLSLVEEDVQPHDEAYREAGNEEAFHNEGSVLDQNLMIQ